MSCSGNTNQATRNRDVVAPLTSSPVVGNTVPGTTGEFAVDVDYDNIELWAIEEVPGT